MAGQAPPGAAKGRRVGTPPAARPRSAGSGWDSPPKKNAELAATIARSCTRSWAIIFRPAVKQVTKRMIRVIHLIVTEQIPVAKGKGKEECTRLRTTPSHSFLRNPRIGCGKHRHHGKAGGGTPTKGCGSWQLLLLEGARQLYDPKCVLVLVRNRLVDSYLASLLFHSWRAVGLSKTLYQNRPRWPA